MTSVNFKLRLTAFGRTTWLWTHNLRRPAKSKSVTTRPHACSVVVATLHSFIPVKSTSQPYRNNQSKSKITRRQFYFFVHRCAVCLMPLSRFLLRRDEKEKSFAGRMIKAAHAPWSGFAMVSGIKSPCPRVRPSTVAYLNHSTWISASYNKSLTLYLDDAVTGTYPERFRQTPHETDDQSPCLMEAIQTRGYQKTRLQLWHFETHGLQRRAERDAATRSWR